MSTTASHHLGNCVSTTKTWCVRPKTWGAPAQVTLALPGKPPGAGSAPRSRRAAGPSVSDGCLVRPRSAHSLRTHISATSGDPQHLGASHLGRRVQRGSNPKDETPDGLGRGSCPSDLPAMWTSPVHQRPQSPCWAEGKCHRTTLPVQASKLTSALFTTKIKIMYRGNNRK